MMFDYFDGGAFSEQTLRENTGDFQRLHFRQRVMRDVSNASRRCPHTGRGCRTAIGSRSGLALPVCLRGGEKCKRLGQRKKVMCSFCLSTVSICSLEEVADAMVLANWFQLYVLKDSRAYSEVLLNRAHKAGYSTLVFTVDFPKLGVGIGMCAMA